MMFSYKKIYLSIFLIIIASIFTACSSQNIVSHSFFALDTAININCSEKNAKEIEKLVHKYEGILSVTDEKSEMFQVNNKITTTVSPEFSSVFKEAQAISEETEGAYNFAIYPIIYEWGFTTKNFKVPEKEKLDSLLSKIDFTKVKINDNIINVENGAMLDFGGIAKGYICDEAVKLLKRNGENNALISLGGNIYALGSKNGEDWQIAIKDPFSEGYAGILHIQDKAVVTSGDYERYFEKKGKKYHHIIDPKTGYPAETSLKSVTVVSESATLADGYSTALFVMGYEKAMKFYDRKKNFEAIFIFDNGEIAITDGLISKFHKE